MRFWWWILLGVIIGILLLGIRYYQASRAIGIIDGAYDAFVGKKNLVHVAIIGSGPAGLGAAIYCARFKRNTLVFEGEKPGGLLTETSMVENWPGYVTIAGGELMEKMRVQAKRAGALFAQDQVTKVDFSVWPFVLHTVRGELLHALSVIISSGAVPRTLGVTGEQQYWGRGVTTCAKCDAPFYKGKRVVVVGGGDSAVEQALQLAQYAKEVLVLVRKDALRASATMQAYLTQYPHIIVRYQAAITKIEGDGAKVTGVVIANLVDKSTKREPIDGVFLAIGHEPNSTIFSSVLNRDHEGYIRRYGGTYATSVPGIFSAGEVSDRKYRQAIVACGEGVSAAIDANDFLARVGVSPSFDRAMQEWWYGIYGINVPHVATIKELDALLIEHNMPVLVYFFDEHCPTCQNMNVRYEAAVKKYKDSVLFVRVDVNDAQEVVRKYTIKKVPAFYLFHNNTVIDSHVGGMDDEAWEKLLQKVLK